MNGMRTPGANPMPMHDYKCPNGHVTTVLVRITDKDEPKETIPCGLDNCMTVAERLAPLTGTPILKPGGVGGFYKPSRA